MFYLNTLGEWLEDYVVRSHTHSNPDFVLYYEFLDSSAALRLALRTSLLRVLGTVEAYR